MSVTNFARLYDVHDVALPNVFFYFELTDKEPDVWFSVQALFVDFAEHSSSGDDVEEADDDARVLTPQVANRVRRVGQERLPRHDLNAYALAVRLQIFHRLEKKF